MLQVKYWQVKEFICPIKTAVMDMTKDWYIHTLAWGAWYLDRKNILIDVPFYGYEELSAIMVFAATAISVILGILRCGTAGINLYKAWRDRRYPEKH